MIETHEDREDYELGEFQEPVETIATTPHSREAEEAVLGAIFIDPANYQDVVNLIVWDDFYITRNKWVFQAFVELDASGTKVDPVTVMDWMVKNGYGDEVTPAYLTALISNAPASYNAVDYAVIVHGYSLRRQYIQQANEIVQIAYDTKLPIESVVGKIETITATHVTTAKRTWQSAEEATDEMIARVTGGVPVAVQTHIPDLDQTIGGIPIEALSLLMGDASLGKTALLYQIAQQVNMAGDNALFITLEEPNWRMVSRTVFTNAKVDKKDWRKNALTPVQLQDIERNAKSFKARSGKLFFDNKSRTVSAIQRSIRQTKAKFVVVDDLRHTRLDERRYNSSDTSALIDVATRLKELAFDEHCALTAIHHVTAEEAAKFWGDNGKKPDDNYPPSIDSIAWARDLRYTIDQWLFMVPDYQAIKNADVMKILVWQMKDKETSRFNYTELLYDRPSQWFYDFAHMPLGMYANKIYNAARLP